MNKEYEKYKLEWMIDHNYSLEDLMNRIAEIINEELAVDGNPYVFINEAFNILEKETGFNGSGIWRCEDEWKDKDVPIALDILEEKQTLFENIYSNLEEYQNILKNNTLSEENSLSENECMVQDIENELDGLSYFIDDYKQKIQDLKQAQNSD